VTSLALSPKGDILAAVSVRDQVVLYPFPALDPPVFVPRNGASPLAFSADGRLLAFPVRLFRPGKQGPAIQIYDLRQHKETLLPIPSGWWTESGSERVTLLAFSEDGQSLIAGLEQQPSARESRLLLWSLSPRPTWLSKERVSSDLAALYFPSPREYFIILDGKELTVLQMPARKRRTLPGYTPEEWLFLEFAAGGQMLWGGDGEKLWVWALPEGRIRKAMPLPEYPDRGLRPVTITSDGSWLIAEFWMKNIVAGRQGLLVWDWAKGRRWFLPFYSLSLDERLARTREGNLVWSRGVAVSADRRWVLVATNCGKESRFYLWDMSAAGATFGAESPKQLPKGMKEP
jgi:WD40 repeat protein